MTHKPRGCMTSILSLTRSPISLIHAFMRSRSFGSGHEQFWRVDDSNFFIYAFNKSESNFGRGEVVFDRGDDGERKPGMFAI